MQVRGIRLEKISAVVTVSRKGAARLVQENRLAGVRGGGWFETVRPI